VHRGVYDQRCPRTSRWRRGRRGDDRAHLHHRLVEKVSRTRGGGRWNCCACVRERSRRAQSGSSWKVLLPRHRHLMMGVLQIWIVHWKQEKDDSKLRAYLGLSISHRL
jgi:hypothetical protein